MLVYDLYSGPGGVGWALDAINKDYGIDIRHVGIDSEPFGDTYPGAFVQEDATRPPLKSGPDLLWMSPVCFAYSRLNRVNAARYDWDETPRERYPTFDDLDVRQVIQELAPDEYIIENVPGCDDLRSPVKINGLHFGLPFSLTRHFETSFDCADGFAQGRGGIGIGSGYTAPELADAKNIPREWGEDAINSAIPREYVQFLLHYCPSVGGVPLPRGARPRQSLLSEVVQ